MVNGFDYLGHDASCLVLPCESVLWILNGKLSDR